MTSKRVVVDFGTCDCGGRFVMVDHLEPWSTYLNQGIGIVLGCENCGAWSGQDIEIVSTWFDAEYPEQEEEEPS